MTVDVIVISGSMGSGKTTIMAEASDLLIAAGVHHAAIDLDALGIGHLPGNAGDLTYANLSSVWNNYSAAGVRRLLIAAAVENRAELERIRTAIPNARLVVCRLNAELGTMQQRVAMREPGMLRDQFIARVAALERLLDEAGLEDFSVPNQSGCVTETAREILRRAAWL